MSEEANRTGKDGTINSNIPIGPTGKPDLMYNLVRWISRTSYEDLPLEVVDYAKKAILDTLAVTIAGSSQEGIKPVVDLVSEWGGKPESTILVYGGKYPAPMAALAIGPMCRAADYGEVHPYTGHTGEYILPTLLPLAECHGGISGQEFITAWVLGAEIMVRIGHSVQPFAPHTQTGRYFMWRIWGPTSAGAKLLGLSEIDMWNAMGIAYSQAAGDLQRSPDGALSLRVEHGLTASAAIKSILLARIGITGAKNILQGKHGFYNAFEPKNNISLVTERLGEDYEYLNSTMKLYAGCGYAMGANEGIERIMQEDKVRVEDISRIRIGLGKVAFDYSCVPYSLKWNPRTLVECQFSLPYCAAVCAIKGNVSANDFSESTRGREDIRQVIPRIEAYIDPEIDKIPSATFGAKVRVETKDGKEYERDCTRHKGTPENKFTWEDITRKLYLCTQSAAKPIPDTNARKLAELCADLENVKDVAEIVGLVTP